MNGGNEPSNSPVALIECKDGVWTITNDGRALLESMPAGFGVIAVAGSYRSGKSTALNALIKTPGAFKTGSTTAAVTKGLHAVRVHLNGKTALVIDSEGLDSMSASGRSHDQTIFSLSVLLSTSFVFNSMGPITEKALAELSMVVQLSKRVAADRLACWPAFTYLARDFSLETVDADGTPVTQQTYFENCLNVQRAGGDSANEVRKCLVEAFTDRRFFGLPRPVDDDAGLCRLETAAIRPEFIEKMNSLRTSLFQRVRPFAMANKPLDGTTYAAVIDGFLASINTGAIPKVTDTWTLLCRSKNTSLIKTLVAAFSKDANGVAIPAPAAVLRGSLATLKNETMKIYRKKRYSDVADKLEDDLEAYCNQQIEARIGESVSEYARLAEHKTAVAWRPIAEKLNEGAYANAHELLVELVGKTDTFNVDAKILNAVANVSKRDVDRQMLSVERLSVMETDLAEHVQVTAKFDDLSRRFEIVTVENQRLTERVLRADDERAHFKSALEAEGGRHIDAVTKAEEEGGVWRQRTAAAEESLEGLQVEHNECLTALKCAQVKVTAATNNTERVIELDAQFDRLAAIKEVMATQLLKANTAFESANLLHADENATHAKELMSLQQAFDEANRTRDAGRDIRDRKHAERIKVANATLDATKSALLSARVDTKSAQHAAEILRARIEQLKKDTEALSLRYDTLLAMHSAKIDALHAGELKMHSALACAKQDAAQANKLNTRAEESLVALNKRHEGVAATRKRSRERMEKELDDGRAKLAKLEGAATAAVSLQARYEERCAQVQTLEATATTQNEAARASRAAFAKAESGRLIELSKVRVQYERRIQSLEDERL